MKTKGGIRINVGIESKDGTMLTDRSEVKGRWREHFSEPLWGK